GAQSLKIPANVAFSRPQRAVGLGLPRASEVAALHGQPPEQPQRRRAEGSTRTGMSGGSGAGQFQLPAASTASGVQIARLAAAHWTVGTSSDLKISRDCPLILPLSQPQTSRANHQPKPPSRTS